MTSRVSGDKSYYASIAFCIGISSWMYAPGISAEEVVCGRPGWTTTTTYNPRSQAFDQGAIIRYSCKDDKDLILGDVERKCLRNGSWSGDIAVCSKYLKIEEAKQPNEDPEIGANLAIDGNVSTCTRTPRGNKTDFEGHVSSSYISAVRIILQRKGKTSMEVIIKDESDLETKCWKISESTAENYTTKIFHCPTGTFGKYIHVRNNYQALRICEVSAFSSPPVQQCLTPDIPLHGNGRRIVGQPSGTNSEYFFECHDGYKSWGPIIVTCQANGTWSPKSPICEKIYCSRPDAPVNGRVEYDLVNDRVPYNGTARFRCYEGFKLDGQSTIRCIRYATWDFVIPKCKSKTGVTPKASLCSTLPEVANGVLIVNSTGIGSTVWLQCNEGFRPLLDDRIFCLQTGEWSSQSLFCTVIQCETNPFVPHGAAILLNNSSYYGAHLQIKCNRGYTSEETIIRKCEQSGSWGDLNICIETTCGSSITSTMNDDEWIPLNDSSSIRILTCPEGFHIEGFPPISRCLSNGSWSYTSATCKSSFEDSLTPSLILIVAVAVGAGTAIFIICLSTAFLAIRKRRHSRTNTAVFHLENAEHMDEMQNHNFLRKKYHSATDNFQSVIELRPKTNCTNPRKPHSALPNLPTEADPVYAQPFETTTVAKKPSATHINKNDLYNAHIYAEPVDSRRPKSNSSNVPVNVLVSQTGTEVSITKTNMQKDSPTFIRLNQQNCDKQCVIYASAKNSPPA